MELILRGAWRGSVGPQKQDLGTNVKIDVRNLMKRKISVNVESVYIQKFRVPPKESIFVNAKCGYIRDARTAKEVFPSSAPSGNPQACG